MGKLWSVCGKKVWMDQTVFLLSVACISCGRLEGFHFLTNWLW